VQLTEADVSLAWELIRYEPCVDIREGLRRTVEWLRLSLDSRTGTPETGAPFALGPSVG